MKKLNHGLALMMSLVLCIAGSRFGMIANAEGTEGAAGTEVNQEKMAEVGPAEETVKTFVEDGLLTEGIGEITEESESIEEPEVPEKADSIEQSEPAEEYEGSKETEAAEKEMTTEEPVKEESVETTGDKTSTDDEASALAKDEATELEKEEIAKKEVEKVLKTISVVVTFKVVNGSWDDGTTEDKSVTLTGEEGEELKLTSDQIPAVGSKPCDDTYKSGGWDKTPSAEESLTEATTYTYTYSQKQKAIVVKAPEAKTLYYISEAD
ncbi:MAG: hypothetical protein IJR96_10950 [Pseudobutyrivibrio sp.]|nr:hypothetical protein [Pseudobutyrivibrio sp.]